MAITSSVLTGGSNNHTTTSEEVNGVATDFATQGIVSSLTNTNGVAPATGGFAVNAQGTPDATVAVSSGTAYVTGTPTSQSSQKFRVKNSASSNVTISANASGSTKYDWVYIKLDPTNLNTPNTAGDNAATLVTSRSSSSTSDDGTPPTYGYNIAVVTVANGFTTITNGNIRDTRTQTGMQASPTTSSSASWTSLGYTPSTVTANGNRSYSLTFSSVDLTGTVSPGMRLKFTRTSTAPTQCTSLNGTTQYYNKSSPAGTTFTDDFNAGAWIKLTSYAAAGIVSRYNGTSGWSLELNSSGQVLLIGYNAGAANFSQVLSYQSVPLNKWVHVAAQLDMSAFTATTTTSNVMINGVDVPAAVSRGGTNPTALVQPAADLQVGAKNGGSFFPGKLAQVFYSSAKITEATLLTYISQGLAGTETSLVSAYSFNNSIADLNANANNLTANGSAVATNADSPFSIGSFGTTDGLTDYAIIQTAAFSTNTTLVVQVPEANTIPTSGGVSAISYSSHKVPYGFPATKDKWRVGARLKIDHAVTGSTAATFLLFAGFNLNAPIGEFNIGYRVFSEVVKSASSQIDNNITLSKSSSAMDDRSFTTYTGLHDGFQAAWPHLVENPVSLTVATTYYMLADNNAATISSITLKGTQGECIIYADPAHL